MERKTLEQPQKSSYIKTLYNMWTRNLLLLLCCQWMMAAVLHAQREAVEYNEVSYFDFGDKMKDLYQKALRLRFKEAKTGLQSEISRNAYNLTPHYIDDYIDFWRLYINESNLEYKTLKEKKESRAAKLALGDDGSPYWLYTQAEVFLRWALVETKFGDESEIVKDLKRAYALIEENKKRFPDFISNKKTSGLIQMLAAALPLSRRNELGFKVSLKNGLDDVQTVISHAKKNPDYEFAEEVQIMYAVVLLLLGSDNPNHWKPIEASYLDHKSSPVAGYVLASMYINTGQSSKALLILDACPSGDDYYDMDYLTYLKGLCRLHKADNKASTFFNQYIKDHIGTHSGSHHVKDAYQKLAWSYLLQGDSKSYLSYMSEAAKKGEAVLEVDVLAQEEATAQSTPNINLLKARLYVEGGYYDNAAKELASVQETNLKNNNEKIDYHYLNARVMHFMKKYDDALTYYNNAINVQKNSTYHPACAAALYAATIYIYRKDNEKAKTYLYTCIKMSPAHFRASLHGQAQGYLAGL